MTQTQSDDLVTRLRALLAGASEQPWVYRPDKHDDWGWVRGVERDDRDIGPFRPVVAMARDSMVRYEDMRAYRAAGTDPYGPNALLIVEAVNALPTLLDEIQRLQAQVAVAREALDCVSDAMLYGDDGASADYGWSITKLNRARPSIRAALASIEGAAS